MSSLIQTPNFFFFRKNHSQMSKSSGLPPYSKRAFLAIIAVIPVAFGLNVPLNSFASFIPVWGVIMINSIVIATYMTFVMPRVSKLLAPWLNSTTEKRVSRSWIQCVLILVENVDKNCKWPLFAVIVINLYILNVIIVLCLLMIQFINMKTLPN